MVAASAACAEPPKSSIRPVTRPALVAAILPSAAPEAIARGSAALAHPRKRPEGLIAKADRAVAASIMPEVIVRPRLRPMERMTLASPALKGKKTAAPKQSLRGSVCGDPAIRGEDLAPIGSPTRGCGIAEPVKVSSIAAVSFDQPATLDCPTAKALKTWITKGLKPAFGRRKVVALQIFGSYSCRSRNNVRGAKISEHGRGKAIDIAGFIFADGKTWTVRQDYNKSIRKAQKAACGPFGTTLGPGSDGYHEDHLHFDTASYRNGGYCH